MNPFTFLRPIFYLSKRPIHRGSVYIRSLTSTKVRHRLRPPKADTCIYNTIIPHTLRMRHAQNAPKRRLFRRIYEGLY